jgi:hypothetical protein
MPTWVLLVAGALGVLGVYANFRGEPPRAPTLRVA